MTYDLNVKCRSSQEKDKRLFVKRCLELGWDCIAWTTNAVGRMGSGSNTQFTIKPTKNVTLEPAQKREAMVLRSLAFGKSVNHDLRQISRLNVTIDDVMDAHSLTVNNEVVRNFDIIAACPGNSSVMAYLCKTADVDLICLDFSHKLSFALNKKLIDEAIARGVQFEITYSPILHSPSTRKEIINGVRVLVQYLSGRNIVLSSGAESHAQLRGPLDAMGIAQALKIPKHLAAKCVGEYCAAAVQHAMARKMRYLPIEVMSAGDLAGRYPELRLHPPQGSKSIKSRHGVEAEVNVAAASGVLGGARATVSQTHTATGAWDGGADRTNDVSGDDLKAGAGTRGDEEEGEKDEADDDGEEDNDGFIGFASSLPAAPDGDRDLGEMGGDADDVQLRVLGLHSSSSLSSRSGGQGQQGGSFKPKQRAPAGGAKKRGRGGDGASRALSVSAVLANATSAAASPGGAKKRLKSHM